MLEVTTMHPAVTGTAAVVGVLASLAFVLILFNWGEEEL